MKAKLIVFDIAGTTLQDNEGTVGRCFLKAIKKHGFKITDENIRWVMGYRKRDAIIMLLEKENQTVDEDTIDSIHNQFIEELNDYYKNSSIQEVEGISDLFKTLKNNGIRIAVNTGFNRSTTDIIINRLGWAKKSLIDSSITSDEVEHGRPESNMIQTLQVQFNIDDSKAVFKVGDTPSDLLEGKNAGCGKTIGVLYGTHTREELVNYPHDYLVDNVHDLKTILLSNGS
jgi:phosphonatase-like hydrolase